MNYYKAMVSGDDDEAPNLILDLKPKTSRPLNLRPKTKPLPFQVKPEDDVPLTSWSSAFIADKPQPVQEQVVRLFSLQHKYTALMMQYQEEALALEKKYLALVQPLYSERRETITGVREGILTPPRSPTDDRVGIPNFWTQAMKNEPSLADLIAPRDESALAELKDIKLENLPDGKKDFILVFTFGENKYFKNETLTKTYTYTRAVDSGEEDDVVEDIYSSDYAYDESFGDEIVWKNGINLIEEREEDENGEQQKSFFAFFKPPVKPDPEEEEEDPSSIRTYEWLRELDFDYGEVFKEKVIPYAVHWYTGEATLYEDVNEDDEGDWSDEDKDEDDSENDSDVEDSDDE